MEQKTKFIIIGLVVLCIVCLAFFIQAASQQQKLLRESNDLKSENATLASKAKQLENELKGNQGKIVSLQSERDRVIAELSDLQGKFESLKKTRDDLIEKLKEKSRVKVPQPQQAAAVVSLPSQPQQQAPVLQNNEAYWGSVLKAKKELEMQLTDIRSELKNLQLINESLKKEKKQTELEMQLEAQLTSVRSELRNLQIVNESLQREKGILESDINNMRNEKKDLLRQLDYNQKLLDSMSQEVVREKNDKLAIQDGFKTAKAENKALSRQLRSLVKRKMLLDKKIQSLQEDKSAVGKRLKETEKVLEDKVSKIDLLRNELDTLKSQEASAEAQRKAGGPVELPAIVVRSSSAVEKGKVGIQEFPGKILAINLESNFVVIDLGSSSGVKVGDVFSVYRDGSSIGAIGVIQTRSNISACDIRKTTVPLSIGDQVK